MVYMCGLILDKGNENKQLVDKVEILWIDKSTGVPEITG